MALPAPVPGLVVRYAYLWRDEALRGQEEGTKDRPCVVILAVETAHGDTVVTVAPITHAPPRHPETAIEIPAATKRRLGLDSERSWIIAADLNRFVWPGVDLRPVTPGSGRFDYGLLPGSLYLAVKERVLTLARAGKLGSTARHP